MDRRFQKSAERSNIYAWRHRTAISFGGLKEKFFKKDIVLCFRVQYVLKVLLCQQKVCHIPNVYCRLDYE
jgi:hypothetical protein